MKIDRSRTRAAERVLGEVRALGKLRDGELVAYLGHYANGREHGFTLDAGVAGEGRMVAFAENRNSDDVVVYVGARVDFSMAGGVPSERAYAGRHYFEGPRSAAHYIVSFLAGRK